MEQEQLEKIITALIHDQSVIQLVRNRILEINQGRNVIEVHPLAESIRQSSPRVYGDLTDAMLTQVINEIQEHYGDVANITLDDWENTKVVLHLVEMHNYVRKRLAELLHKEGRQIGWGIVGKIINAVFGNVPVITKRVRKSLHEMGFLQYKYSDNIQCLLSAVADFFAQHKADLDTIAIGVIATVLPNLLLGIACTPQALIAAVLSIGISIILQKFVQIEQMNENNRHGENNDENIE